MTPTPEQIAQWAREAGVDSMPPDQNYRQPYYSATPEELQHFAALACAWQAERISELEQICAESYQVVGILADAAGVFEHEAVTKALDNLNDMKLTHDDVIPFHVRR